MLGSPPLLFQDKWGYVSSLLDAEYGVLLWQVAPRQYQSVLFHRSVAHLYDLNLKNYDLRTIFRKGACSRLGSPSVAAATRLFCVCKMYACMYVCLYGVTLSKLTVYCVVKWSKLLKTTVAALS